MPRKTGQPGFYTRKPPSSYNITTQQKLIKDAAKACGVRKGMPRNELVKAMTNCMPQFFEQGEQEVKEDKVIKVYHSPHCQPCLEITELLNKGRFESNIEGDVPIDLVDVTSEEGFKELHAAGVDVSSIPTARYQGQTCKLGVDEDQQVVVIECKIPAASPKPESLTPEV